MRPVPLVFPLAIALFFTLFGTVFVPQLKLFTFAPFLAIVCQRYGRITALWWALGCGLIVDLCSAEWSLGMYPLNFCVVTLLAHRYRRQFFEEKALSLCLFTVLISFFSSVLHLILTSFGHKLAPFSVKSLAIDLLGMPLVDGLYAFVGFSCPFLLYRSSRYLYKRLLNKRSPHA